MKNLKKYGILILTGLFMSSLFLACKKDNEELTGSSTGYMQMEMTDAPGDYLHVYVDVKSVEVHQSDTNNSAGWTTLNTRDTIYDLLLLQNDITAVLADSTLLPVGKITQVRLILGSNNSVVLKDSSTHPLVIPSSMNTGIKINIGATIEPNKTTRVTIDFDADKSINLIGTEYKMSPVIKVKSVVMN